MSLAGGRDTEFAKYSGAGNDFIIIDGTKQRLPMLASKLAKVLCQRAISVGADGLIILKRSKSADADLEWEFYNSDGSTAEFCGNGARCAARFAVTHGLVNAPSLTLKTAAGIVKAVVKRKIVELEFDIQTPDPRQIKLDLGDMVINGYFLTTGVPHFVIFKDALVNDTEVIGVGRKIRYHHVFAPKGTNVDFCKFKKNKIYIRTYERGIENETLACGSGAMAASIAAHKIMGLPKRLEVIPKSGEALFVDMSLLNKSRLILAGPAREVYAGRLKEPWPNEG